ncbi:hypothetical protein PybrP1_007873 [[Pythium] brassicae (nom. inval.)]|nr:hypothetical protein PybrP1_007873 [[Pythium] brassicae (nom. inval.)]
MRSSSTRAGGFKTTGTDEKADGVADRERKARGGSGCGGEDDKSDADDLLKFVDKDSRKLSCLLPVLKEAQGPHKNLTIKTSLARELVDNYRPAVNSDRMHEPRENDGLLLGFAIGLAVVICECVLQVLEHNAKEAGLLGFDSAFHSAAVVRRCIVQPTPLYEALAELYDLPSGAFVTIAVFGGRTGTGSCEVEFGADSSAFIEFLDECAATFHVAVLRQTFKALGNSNETFLCMNADGFLSVQRMVESRTGEKAFVDAFFIPDEGCRARHDGRR